MSKSMKLMAAAIAATMGVAAVSRASTVAINPQTIAYWPDENTFAGGAAGVTPANNNATGVYEVGLFMSTSVSPADTALGYTGFGNAAFDVSLKGPTNVSTNFTTYYGDQIAALPNGNKATYTDALGTVHTDGAGVGATTNVYSTNGDIGTSTSDLKFITVDVGAGVFGATDARLNLGQSGQNAHVTNLLSNPVQVGDVFIDYTGGGTGTFSLISGLAGEGFSLHNNTSGLNVQQTVDGINETYSLGSVSFGVPEPTSLSVLALAGLMAFRRRRA